ncbi:MAG TPA: DUF2127 domain-containing protein [Aestuariivirga sp.]
MISRASHGIYLLSLALKLFFAALEVLCGLAIYFVPLEQIHSLTHWILELRIFADPGDRKTELMQHLISGLPLDARLFVCIYLLLHGGLKIAIVAGLLSGKPLAYPLGLLGLAIFVIYELTEYFLHHHLGILMIAGFDVFIIMMVAREWREKLKLSH